MSTTTSRQKLLKNSSNHSKSSENKLMVKNNCIEKANCLACFFFLPKSYRGTIIELQL